jgi:WD40 repeat protein
VTRCPSHSHLLSFQLEQLPPEDQAAVGRHLETCAACGRALAALFTNTLQPPEDLEAEPTLQIRNGAVLQRAAGKAPPGHHRPLSPADTPSPPLFLPTGPVVGDYELLEVLGRGGMGVVFRARQRSLDRLVALKMIQGAADADAEGRRRFRAEAEALARLQHPNIVQIYEVGEQDGTPFFSLEYVAGGNLQEHLAGRPQPPATAAGLVRTLALAVHYAHERGIVHRDLKPANILLQKTEVRSQKSEDRRQKVDAGDRRPSPSDLCPLTSVLCPKVSDFGLAKHLAGAANLTRSGDVLGTPCYMAPEQANGGNRVGPAADLYALGAILYELLTGRPPFLADSALETLNQILQLDPTPPSRWQPGVPRDLETICLKCLEKEPGRRYASGQELADDLGRYLDGQPIAARRVGVGERIAKWARRHPGVAALLAALVAVTLAGAAFVLLSWRDAEQARQQEAAARLEAEEAQKQAEAAKHQAEQKADQALKANRDTQRATAKLAALRGQALCEEGEVAAGLLWLARGLELAAAAGAADLEPGIRTNLAQWQQWLLPPPRLSPRHGTPVMAVAFSPDGQTMATGAWWWKHNVPNTPAEVQLWKVGTWEQIGKPMLHPEPVRALAFGPDGTALLSTSLDGKARLWDVATCEMRFAPLAHRGRTHVAAFTRDGRAAMTGGSVWVNTYLGKFLKGGEVCFWDTATGQRLGEPLDLDSPVLSGAFGPDDGHFLVGCLDKTARWFSYPTRQQVGPALGHPGAVWAVAVSPDGRTVLTAGDDGSARLYDVATRKQVGTTLHHTLAVTSAAFSPDGGFVLTGSGVVTGSHPSDLWTRLGEVRLWDAATGRQVGHTLEHHMKVHAVAFSPDGQWFASGSEDGHARLWPALPAAARPTLLPQAAGGTLPRFSPDGKLLAVVGDRHVHCWDVATRRLAFALPYQKFKEHEPAVAFSPDGQTLVAAGMDGKAHLWDAATGRPRREPLDHQGPILAVAFSPDGRTLATAGGASTTRRWDVASGREVGPALTFSEGAHNHVAFSPDGRLLVIGAEVGEVRVWDAATGQPAGPPFPGGPHLKSLSFRPDGKAVLVTRHPYQFPGHAHLWDVAAGKPVGVALPDAGLQGIVSPDGRFFLALNPHRPFARLGDAATGKPIGPPLAHRQPVLAGAVSPDSRLALTGSHDHTARLWDTATGQPLGWPLMHNAPVEGVAFHPDGRWVATTTQDKGVRLWQLTAPVTGTAAQVRRRVQQLTGQELDEHGALRRIEGAGR